MGRRSFSSEFKFEAVKLVRNLGGDGAVLGRLLAVVGVGRIGSAVHLMPLLLIFATAARRPSWSSSTQRCAPTL
jgi:hypothetical protein